MTTTPYFSVVTPSFNQAEWIEGCIKSVLGQGTEDFEHVVFDNCSTDGTREILARYPHLVSRSEPDTGQANAINKALKLARGEVICWLNADDQYVSDTFRIVREQLSKPGVDVIFGNAHEIFFDGRAAGVRTARFERREDILIWWEKRVDILQPAVFFKRSILDRVGPLREDLHLILDTELWWRISEVAQFHYIDAPLAVQQRQPESKTIKSVQRIYEEKARVFDPILRAAEPRRWFGRLMKRHFSMGRRWLGLAQSAVSNNRAAALHFLGLSLRENPLMLCTPRWWMAWVWALRRGQ